MAHRNFPGSPIQKSRWSLTVCEFDQLALSIGLMHLWSTAYLSYCLSCFLFLPIYFACHSKKNGLVLATTHWFPAPIPSPFALNYRVLWCLKTSLSSCQPWIGNGLLLTIRLSVLRLSVPLMRLHPRISQQRWPSPQATSSLVQEVIINSVCVRSVLVSVRLLLTGSRP